MRDPGPQASDAELAAYYEEHHDPAAWGTPQSVPTSSPNTPGAQQRLDVTLSVRFTAAEIAAVRARAEAAGMKPTTYIRRLALVAEQPPLDRGQVSRLVETLTRDLEDLRHATS